MTKIALPLCLIALAGALALPSAAHAQRADENAVKNSEDAFGTSIGQERTGIYTDRNTRGFSPLDAGNVRIDGIYFDQVSILAGRLRRDTAIRVGFSAIDFPFVAPTGVVDHHFRPFPTDSGNSITTALNFYGGHIDEWDFRVPLLDGHLGLTGGIANANFWQVDRAKSVSWGLTVRPILRIGGVEFAPYASAGEFAKNFAKPLAVVRDGYLPDQPPSGQYLGQNWASGHRLHQNFGATIKAKITDKLSLRGGYFYSVGDQLSNFSEIYQVVGPGGASNHFVFADPRHAIDSTSGEAQVALSLGNERFRHRFFAGYRFRDRQTETGGSHSILRFFDPNEPVIYGVSDPLDQPAFSFTPINAGRVRQSSLMLGYVGQLEGVGHLNIGIQKARYRARSLVGATGVTNRSRANPWLYNATLMIEITPKFSVYVASQRGLEDSGLAPENAANRNDQLPATKATQYEGGVRWDFGKGKLVVSAFQISKPYFTFDGANNFVERGQRRHRGLELSLTGHFGDRLDIVAGAVLMDPVVTGAALTGPDPVGKRPAGTPTLFGQLDANYRTDFLGGLVLTAGLNYTGKRAATARPVAHLGDQQLMLPGWMRVDLGLRQRFKLGKIDVSLRAVVQNVLNEKHWNVVAADVLIPEERRKLLLILTTDF
ncbi:MAG: TonB-dependent receptor [Novosphingobium sp.]|nr:TonB-dependent receptor [Novosphingobium sp.]